VCRRALLTERRCRAPVATARELFSAWVLLVGSAYVTVSGGA
jgi:hypothetical protein